MFVWIKLLHQSNLRKMLKHFGDFAPKQDFKKLFFFHMDLLPLPPSLLLLNLPTDLNSGLL